MKNKLFMLILLSTFAIQPYNATAAEDDNYNDNFAVAGLRAGNVVAVDVGNFDDVRLQAVVGHVPTVQDYARDAHLLGGVGGAVVINGGHPTAEQHVADRMIAEMEGVAQTDNDAYVKWHAALDGIITAGTAALNPTYAEFAVAVRLAQNLNDAQPPLNGAAIGNAWLLPTWVQIEEGLRIGNNAGMDEIEESIRYFGATGNLLNFAQLVASNVLNEILVINAGHIGPNGLGDRAAARLAGIADINATARELDEYNRLMNDPQFIAGHPLAELLDYSDVQAADRIRHEAPVRIEYPSQIGYCQYVTGLTLDQIEEARDPRELTRRLFSALKPSYAEHPNPYAFGLTFDQLLEARRLREQASVDGIPNPYAGDGLGYIALEEAFRLKALPEFIQDPYAGAGLSYIALEEAVRLKAMPEFAQGATVAELQAALYIKTVPTPLTASPTAEQVKLFEYILKNYEVMRWVMHFPLHPELNSKLLLDLILINVTKDR